MAEVSINQASFSLSRTINASVERVYKAFADKDSKEKWFKGPGSETESHTMDFKVGGRESSSGKFPDGVTHRLEAIYLDIVPSKRIIYAYEMYLNDKKISVSLATVEFQATGDQTQLTLSESDVFLESGDNLQQRQQGTQDLLETLIKSLKEN